MPAERRADSGPAVFGKSELQFTGSRPSETVGIESLDMSAIWFKRVPGNRSLPTQMVEPPLLNWVRKSTIEKRGSH